ncbi:MarR family winged helix-turn-helix transcriptional regulator [Rhodococcus sp. NPDC056960]|uniref:MarR family winged helix-turn-helix transcriptional regulator n=1 Tax=Rhodococcus sp. NPDC056960 TaxID=3345982 RepID=UPI0036315D71
MTTVDIISSLMRTQRMLSSQLNKAFTPYGVSWAGYEILQMLVPRNPISILTLARELERHWTSIAHTVNGLERSGHVIRYRNPSYRRENLVEMTDSGYDACTRVNEVLAVTAGACLPDDDVASALLAGLGALETELRRPPQNGVRAESITDRSM